MTYVKELYMGKRLDDLDRQSVIPDVKSKKTHMLLESARKLYQEAEKYNRERDEERAYIFYMKYFNLLHCIRKKPDYAQHKQDVRKMLGGNTSQKQTMDQLELLSKSLNRRYAQIEPMTMPTTNATHRSIRDYQHYSDAEKYDNPKSESTRLTAISPTGGELSQRSLNSISCQELFERTKEHNVLIMDCRTSVDYKISHLTYNWAFNVPEELVLAGMSAGKLQDKLDSNAKVLWSARSVKDNVVLMDWNCKDASASPNSTIAILLDILRNWDPDVTYRAPIKILEGGYEYFIMMYPTLCTNPSVQAPQQNNEDLDLIDDIEYPNIHDITMKDEIRYSIGPTVMTTGNASTSSEVAYQARPSVDRSSKQAAIKTYDEKQKPIVEILKEQDELIEKAQVNDAQLKQAAQKWNSIFEREDVQEQSALTSSQQELLYNIMQLESTAEDYKVENNRLRDELEIYKRLEKEQQQQISPNKVNAMEEATMTKKIETQIEERAKLDEQHEREKQQRDMQLALARENKRHMKPPIIEDGEISKPKIPQFDRSIKPSITPTNATPAAPEINALATTPQWSAERHRDFSPVRGNMGRGLTGLKNLGNTCYMNSILQCLSNTSQLTEYCITDKYKNYISRGNQTKGHIVEEVAALIKILWNGNYKCVASKDFRYVIGQYQQIFRGIQQQDSHEFLTILMDLLHSDLQTLHVPDKPRDNVSASEKAWLEFTKAKESLILHLFYGQIKSTVKCVACKKESATYECFSNLSLELPSNANVCHLSQCMEMYFSGELIHGWNCPSCKQKRDAIKKLDISKLPPVLVVHMKRFYADTEVVGNAYKKKQNYVRFPLENLDMTPHIAKSELRSVTPKTYQLYGVSNHYGSMESGHYTAFCKSGNYGRWFKFDDQVVTPLDTSNVVSSAAYILFYTWLPPIQINETN